MRAPRIRRDAGGGGLWYPNTGVKVNVVLPAGRTIAFAGFIVPQASQLEAAADAIAVTRIRCRLDRNERHGKE